MRKSLTSGWRRYTLAFVVVATSLGVMGAQCQPPKTVPSGLSLDPTSWDFGNKHVGDIDTVDFTVTNNGPGTTGPLAVSVQGGDAGEFGLFGPGCAGETLGPGDSCSQGVLYAPTKPQHVSASFVVAASPGGTATAGLQGTGFPPNT
jgi:hypothetical protein